ncbi:MAG: P-aminobenzoate N-oxygenase AurF [Blastocatellia bacterium]|nr:P-aminobenzoate N-oxygenase AurF [Blastocatellia bacterium]
MNKALSQVQEKSLLDDTRTFRKLELNYRKNRSQDHSPEIDSLASRFRYEEAKDSYWNPEQFSLLYGTPLWEQATEAQRVKLNQLYWVAYYSQIISAEIATIFFNQTSAAGLYAIEDFRLVCDTMDLESAQERSHINAFKKVGEDFEENVFGERIFTYHMRGPFVETMICHNSNRVKEFWRWIELHAFALLSSDNAFIGCQYFAVRGIRTLNGKLIQHQLGQFYSKHTDKEKEDFLISNVPIPSQLSYCHFLDESFHFNSSTIISHDVLNSLRRPTAFEKWVANRALLGTQADHYHFSTAINGLFWYDPALFPKVYKILRSPLFDMDDRQARQMMVDCFTKETDGLHLSAHSRQTAIDSYRQYLADIDYVSRDNKEMSVMRRNSVAAHLKRNSRELKRFFLKMEAQ